jgi:2-polyprenyl-6-methoxyphenol hydroxylase-like FAD-dependent oxidoreductase
MEWPLGRAEVDLFFSEEGLVVIAPLPNDHFRIVATVNETPASEPSQEEFQRILDQRGPKDANCRILDVVWSSRFHVSHRVSSSLHKGPFLLAGDAAHVHSPAGGQGMNTGIQDAMSLAAALESAVRDEEFGALDKWEQERLKVARSVVAFTDRMTRVATLSSPLLKAIRNTAIGFAGHVPHVQHALAEKLAELDRRAR